MKYKLIIEGDEYYFVCNNIKKSDKFQNRINYYKRCPYLNSSCIYHCKIMLGKRKDIRFKNKTWAIQNLQSDNIHDKAIAEYIVKNN